MKIIEKPSEYFLSVWPKQNFNGNTTYRPLKYIRNVTVKDGILWFNMLSGEIILFSNEEAERYSKTSQISDQTAKELVEKWFLVPEDNNDSKLSKQLVSLFESLNCISLSSKLSTFIILPTTDCNARCFYCYELGRSRKNMTLKTAEDVVSFIMKNKADGKIKFQWFGGEPLYNVQIIDYISERLKENGVEFVSQMISNAYLFDDDMIFRAKKDWHLKQIQITIDGTEEIYNRTKAYIHKDCDNPFERVMANVEKLLKNGIAVNIRLNMDMHNIDDVFALSDYLKEKFIKYDNMEIYPHLLYDYAQKFGNNRNEVYLKERFAKLQQMHKNTHKQEYKYFEMIRFKDHCMADTDSSIVILPEGQLTKCEHDTDSNFIGTIYDDKIDHQKLIPYKKLGLPLGKCDECEMRPLCVRLEYCPNRRKFCDERDKESVKNAADNRIMLMYNYRLQHPIDSEEK